MIVLPYSPRPATEDDLEQIRDLESRFMLKPWSLESLKEELENKQSTFWVVTDDASDSEVIAYVILRSSYQEAHLLSVVVKETYRKKGIAEWILRKLISKCEKDKIETIFLDVGVNNNTAIHLYQKLGFVILRTMKNFYPGNINAYSMAYKIKQTKIEIPKEKGAEFERKNFN